MEDKSVPCNDCPGECGSYEEAHCLRLSHYHESTDYDFSEIPDA